MNTARTAQPQNPRRIQAGGRKRPSDGALSGSRAGGAGVVCGIYEFVSVGAVGSPQDYLLPDVY